MSDTLTDALDVDHDDSISTDTDGRGSAPSTTSAVVQRVGSWTTAATVSAVAIAISIPVLVIVWSIVQPSTEVWEELWATRLPGMIRDTATLLAAVLFGTLVLGTSLAWLVTAYQFPGRRLLGWLLVTPLAIPGYVLGFVWLDTFQEPLGARGVRSIWLCALVLTITLYPYVYLFARAAFREQSQRAIDVARSLGCSRSQAFWRVVLPMARPSLAGGAALVGMEVLTDVGTVRLFNVSTIADGVLRVWFGTGNRNAAAELAVLLIGIAIVLIAMERLAGTSSLHAIGFAGRTARRTPARHPGGGSLGDRLDDVHRRRRTPGLPPDHLGTRGPAHRPDRHGRR